MTSVLVAWLGNNDLKAAGVLPKREHERNSNGPILGALNELTFDELHLLCDQGQADTEAYALWLSGKSSIKIKLHYSKLDSPIDFGEVYAAANGYLETLYKDDSKLEVSIHLSPGTPTMTAVSILLGKTKFDTRFVQSSREHGGEFVDIPFNISAEFIPGKTTIQDKRLVGMSVADSPVTAEFADIVAHSPEMLNAIKRAEKVAGRNVPALILGESGTGKELFSIAMHNASQRKNSDFIIVNCGAIPKDLIDSELFGHAKGAFSGATSARKGYFEAADRGTIFLDEFGELPEDAQVRLLRVLQSGEFSRVGETQTIKVDVRVIAATNRDLAQEVAEGRFREDLFYRVAVGIINLPPLRERSGDVGVLADHLMNVINKEAKDQPGYINKKISVKAKNIILSYAWPGNVRELHGALLRASLWSESDTITETDMQDSLLEKFTFQSKLCLPEIGKGVDIQGIIENVKEDYIQDALKQTAGNKKKAAKLLGLTNYQTLTNWIDKLSQK